MKDEFLIKLKAAAKNKKGTVSPTVAGILMFGEADRITDVFPDYFLDYREECDDKKVRWLYRTHSNEGDWSGNLFDFFYKVTTRIDDDVAVPFVKRREGVRVDRVDVHDALSEAVANALVHANYYGKRGIVIVKHGKTITISNPGTIRITKEEFYAGGNSDPRNPNLLKIFDFVNVGERAGSGVDKIMTAWEEQNWEKPIYDISLRAERVTLQLEVGQIVYIPGAADLRKENEYNSTYNSIWRRNAWCCHWRCSGIRIYRSYSNYCHFCRRIRNACNRYIKFWFCIRTTCGIWRSSSSSRFSKEKGIGRKRAGFVSTSLFHRRQ